MFKKKIVVFFFLIFTLFFLAFFIYSKFNKNLKISETLQNKNTVVPQEENQINSNVIKDVNYVTRDADGNEYIVKASKGEIDFNNDNILFLTNVKALIRLKNSSEITIISDFGKYNTDNFDTIFSKNVIINYLDNKITSEYLDFSLEKNLMIISKDVVYNNIETTLNGKITVSKEYNNSFKQLTII